MNTKTKNPKGARSLTFTLAIAFFSLSVVVLLVNGGLAVYANYQASLDTLAVRQLLIAQDASKTVASSIEEKFTGLETAVEFANPIQADSVARKNIMESLLGLHPAFRQFALLDGRGRQVDQVSRISQSLSPQFMLQLQGDPLTRTAEGQRYISPVYIDDVTSEPLIAIAIPVMDVLGDYQGTMLAEVNLKFMWDLVDQLKVGESGYVYVVDNQGNLIAFGDTTRVLANENVRQIFEVSEFVDNTDAESDLTPDVGGYTGLLGATVVGTYVPLGAPDWAVIIELPTTEANQPVLQSMLASIVTILVFAVLAGLIGIFVARRLAAPLVDLSNAATEIASGNFGVKARVGGPAEIAQVATAFNAMTSRLHDLITSLEQRVTDRTRDLEIVAEVGTATATILESERLLQAVVELTKERFQLYHSHIYLLDIEGKNLVLTAGAGEPGRIMVAEKRSIPLDREQSLVARAARERKGVTVNDVTQAQDFLPNPLLPDTRSELAVPMIVGGNVIGVFDIQSEQVGRFTDSDVNIQTTLAAQLAISIQNVRSFEQSKKQAELESLVNVIGQKIQRTTSVEETLQTAIREMGLALGASRVKVKLGNTINAGSDNNANS